jgi:hypothetical protein
MPKYLISGLHFYAFFNHAWCKYYVAVAQIFTDFSRNHFLLMLISQDGSTNNQNSNKCVWIRM